MKLRALLTGALVEAALMAGSALAADVPLTVHHFLPPKAPAHA